MFRWWWFCLKNNNVLIIIKQSREKIFFRKCRWWFQMTNKMFENQTKPKIMTELTTSFQPWIFSLLLRSDIIEEKHTAHTHTFAVMIGQKIIWWIRELNKQQKKGDNPRWICAQTQILSQFMCFIIFLSRFSLFFHSILEHKKKNHKTWINNRIWRENNSIWYSNSWVFDRSKVH